jgi:hypothetical protein
MFPSGHDHDCHYSRSFFLGGGAPRRGGGGGRILRGLPYGNSRRLGPPLEGALCGGQPTGMARRNTGRRGRLHLKGLRGGQTSQALPLLVERERRQVQDTQ